MPADHPVVALKGAKKAYAGTRVLNDLTIDFRRGHVSVILGPSGGGKTTILRAISLLTPLDEGCITMNGALHGYEQAGATARCPSASSPATAAAWAWYSSSSTCFRISPCWRTSPWRRSGWTACLWAKPPARA